MSEIITDPQMEAARIEKWIQNLNREHLQELMELLDPVCVLSRTQNTNIDDPKYSVMVHAKLCRMKMLGFDHATAAKAVGITHVRLNKWIESSSQLKSDLDQAFALSSANVASILRKLMHEKGPVGLNAVKYFLSARTDEFKERAEVKVDGALTPERIRETIRDIYGVNIADGDGTSSSETDNPAV